MNGEIQGDHYGVQVNMKLEGSTITFRRDQAGTNMIGDNLLAQHPKIYFAHLSDDGTQSCETSYYNFTKQVEYLQQCQIYDPNIRHIFYDNTDGCTDQYRCSKAVYLMSILACTYKVDIDRLIHPPSHEKDKVDGLNAVTKRYLQLCTYNTANATDKD